MSIMSGMKFLPCHSYSPCQGKAKLETFQINDQVNLNTLKRFQLKRTVEEPRQSKQRNLWRMVQAWWQPPKSFLQLSFPDMSKHPDNCQPILSG
jgi:hypothetical protein